MPVRHPIAFWAQQGTADLIVFVEQDGDGERSLLRMCFVQREEEGDREQAGFFMREDGMCFAVDKRVFDQLLFVIADDFGDPYDWEDTTGMIFGAVRVDMRTAIFENEEAIKLMSNTAEESHQSRVVPFLGSEFSESFPVREDASSPKLARPICSSAGGRSMPAPCEVAGASLEFSLDSAEDGEGFREGQSMNLPVPSNSARLNMSEGERKWYSSHWIFDWNIKHLCKGLTAGEKEWLSRLFDVDLNNVNVGDVVLSQERMWLLFLSIFSDKTVSGEYILERPPKKPGGLKLLYTCLIIIWMLVQGGECHGTEEGAPIGSLEEIHLLLAMAAVFVLIRLLLVKDDRESDLRKMRKFRQRKNAKRKTDKRRKRTKAASSPVVMSPSKSEGSTFSRVSERDKFLDKRFGEVLNQDIKRSTSSACESVNQDITVGELLNTSEAPVPVGREIPDFSVDTVPPTPCMTESCSVGDLFNIELHRFTAISPSVRIHLNVDVDTLLWNKFGEEIARLGKDFSALEDCPSNVQQEIIEWFLVRVQSSIEEIHCEEGHGWIKSVSMYLDRLLSEQREPDLERSVGSEEVAADSDMDRVALGEREKINSDLFVLPPCDEEINHAQILEENLGSPRSNLDGHASDVEMKTLLGPDLFVLLPSDEEINRSQIVDDKMRSVCSKSGANSCGVARVTLPDPATRSETCEPKQKESGLKLESDFKFPRDDATDATAEVSDSSVSDSTSCGGVDGVKKWSTVVNGIHFVGIDRSGGSPPLCDEVEDSEVSQPHEETKKERHKRLLTLDRESKTRDTKVKRIPRQRNHHFSPVKLPPIKEEKATGASEDLCETLVIPGQEGVAAIDRRREVELILIRKFKLSGRVMRDKRRVRRKVAKVTPFHKLIGLDCWDNVVRRFAYAIRLYSCSAARYAMFRSNRSLKPGD